jgi:hypothetical protein
VLYAMLLSFPGHEGGHAPVHSIQKRPQLPEQAASGWTVDTAEQPIVMTDLAKWKLHGTVKALQSEIAEWDPERQHWHPARHRTSAIFDGPARIMQLDQPRAEGSVHRTTYLYDDEGRLAEVNYGTFPGSAEATTLYSYDPAGRLQRVVEVHPGRSDRTIAEYVYDASGTKTKTEFLPAQTSKIAMAYGIEGSEMGYGVPRAATVTTRYDDRDRPVDAVFHDATHALLRTITFTRDSAGRVVTEDARMAQAGPAQFEGALGDLSRDDHANFAAILGAAIGSIVTTFTYDAAGRLVERRRRTGALSDERTTFAYDDHSNPLEERTERRDREMRIEEDGGMRPTPDTVRTDEWRFEYTYDSAGNWTERVVWARFDGNADFQRSNVERRTIEYYAG